MVGEGGEAHVVVRVDAQGVTVAFGGVGDTVHHEVFGNFAHVGIQDAVNTLGPHGGELAVGVLYDSVYIALEHGVEFCLDGQVVAILQSGIGTLGNHAVGTDHIQHVAEVGASPVLELTVQADELEGAVVVGLADNEHFRQVRILGLVLQALVLDHFRFEEREGGEAPAGAAAVLVLDGGDGIFLDHGELVVFRFHRSGVLCACADASGEGGEGCHKDDGFTHIVLLNRFLLQM